MAESLPCSQTLAQFFFACSMEKWQKNWAGPESEANVTSVDTVDGKCICSLHPDLQSHLQRISTYHRHCNQLGERERWFAGIYLLGGGGGGGSSRLG